MKYFVPQLESITDATAQNVEMEKLGGLPFGLPTEMYPTCKECRKPMSLLAQFIHHEERLNLGKNGRVLSAFQCNNMASDFSVCPNWNADLGANVCFIVEPENLSDRFAKSPEEKIVLENEFLITGWQEMDDGISEEESLFFLDVKKYDAMNDETAKKFCGNLVDGTKLGGVPVWIQYPEIPQGAWKYAAQLDSATGFVFGDAGIGHIFIEKVESALQLPKGKFLWQCS